MNKADNWISATLETLKKASPTSLKVFLRLVCVLKLLNVIFYRSLKVYYFFIVSFNGCIGLLATLSQWKI